MLREEQKRARNAFINRELTDEERRLVESFISPIVSRTLVEEKLKEIEKHLPCLNEDERCVFRKRIAVEIAAKQAGYLAGDFSLTN
jgi:hypothetical protein